MQIDRTSVDHGQPVVIIENGEAKTDSRDVAAFFQRNHRDVLRAIRELHCSPEFRQRNFAPIKVNDLTGETLSHVLMTKDGFAFVALGFTGRKAGEFKEAYIARFNAIQAALADRYSGKADAMAILSDPTAMRTLLLGYAERELALKEEVQTLQPKAMALERLSEASGSLCVTDAAKALQIRPKELFTFLRSKGWLYRRHGATHDRGYEGKVAAGYLEHKMSAPDDRGRTFEQVRVTPKGLAKLAQALNPSAPVAP
ncbi:MAG: phage regulatory protein/antirepressor Ant [Proteobacteria bacterium]|nr:phage regulatory protein/antirepressor Ant [Pseudomonadota bacterium]